MCAYVCVYVCVCVCECVVVVVVVVGVVAVVVVCVCVCVGGVDMKLLRVYVTLQKTDRKNRQIKTSACMGCCLWS